MVLYLPALVCFYAILTTVEGNEKTKASFPTQGFNDYDTNNAGTDNITAIIDKPTVIDISNKTQNMGSKGETFNYGSAPSITRKSKCTAYLKPCSPSTKKNKPSCCNNLECVEVGESKLKNYFCLPVYTNSHESSEEDTGSPGSSKCPYTARIEQILEPLDNGPEFENTVESLKRRKTQALRAAATRGDRAQNYHISIRNIHLAMRTNYREMINEIGTNIYPLIVASDTDTGVGYVSGVGGIFTLYLEDGTVKRIIPTSKEFEMLKNLAHIPLGIFTIVSPYFLTPKGLETDKLRSFQAKIKDAIYAGNLGGMNLSEDLIRKGMTMLNTSNNYIDNWLRNGYVTVSDFEEYSSKMFPFIENSIKKAASLQVQALLPHLKKWKDELGDKWKDVYAIIPTIWPVSAINPRLQVLSQLMSPEQVKTQVLLLESGGTLSEKRATLGRIVGDRAAALLILNTKTKEQKELTFALSTKQDLLANSCADAISEYLKTNPVKV